MALLENTWMQMNVSYQLHLHTFKIPPPPPTVNMVQESEGKPLLPHHFHANEKTLLQGCVLKRL